MPCPPLWPCNKVLKPNFQFIISQTNNGCSFLSLILAKLLLLDISCGNTFALSVVTALTARPFLIKKCAEMSVFHVKTAKIRWWLGQSPHTPSASGGWGESPQPPFVVPLLYKILGAPLFPNPPIAKPWLR